MGWVPRSPARDSPQGQADTDTQKARRAGRARQYIVHTPPEGERRVLAPSHRYETVLVRFSGSVLTIIQIQ